MLVNVAAVDFILGYYSYMLGDLFCCCFSKKWQAVCFFWLFCTHFLFVVDHVCLIGLLCLVFWLILVKQYLGRRCIIGNQMCAKAVKGQ